MARSSTAARVGAILTPTLLAALSIVALIDHPDAPAAWLIGLIAVILGVVAVFDLPVESRATDVGIVRTCPGRTEVLPWTHVAAIETGRSLVALTTVTGQRYLLATGSGYWRPHPSVPDSVVFRRSRRRSPANSYQPPRSSQGNRVVGGHQSI